MVAVVRGGSSLARLTLLVSSLYADVVRASTCEDGGPFPCNEDGCPSASITCASLKNDCNRAFSDVWKSPPDGLDKVAVWTICRKTCGKCAKESAGGAKPTSTQAGTNSRCVKWRQTADCSASGKRQPQSDRDCHVRIKQGWSGYCECEGGVRAGESTCEHEEFTCNERCEKQWAWLREQRANRAPDGSDTAGKEEDFSADDALTKLYKRGKQFYVMGNTELVRGALRMRVESAFFACALRDRSMLGARWRAGCSPPAC